MVYIHDHLFHQKAKHNLQHTS